MILAAHEAPYTLILEQDDNPVDPRSDCDPFGHMVCWHRRYRLGDEHQYDSSEDLLRSLCLQYVDDGEALEELTITELKAMLHKQPDIVILPLYLYDHSGLSISTGSFVGRAPHAQWDSGQVGYIYADRDDITREYGSASPENVAKARTALEAEVGIYDGFLRGECYGYRLYTGLEETDSLWGFLGDIDGVKPQIREYLPEECRHLTDKLEMVNGTHQQYLWNLAVHGDGSAKVS